LWKILLLEDLSQKGILGKTCLSMLLRLIARLSLGLIPSFPFPSLPFLYEQHLIGCRISPDPTTTSLALKAHGHGPLLGRLFDITQQAATSKETSDDDVLGFKYGLTLLMACFFVSEDSLRETQVLLESSQTFFQWLLDTLMLSTSIAVRETASKILSETFTVQGAIFGVALVPLLAYVLKSLLAILPAADQHPFASADYFVFLVALIRFTIIFSFFFLLSFS